MAHKRCFAIVILAMNTLWVSIACSAAGLTPVEIDELAGDAPKETANEYADTLEDIDRRPLFEAFYARFGEGFGAQVHSCQSLTLKSDRDPADIVLRRTRALLDDLIKKGVPLEKEQANLERLAGRVESTNAEDKKTRFDIFVELTALRKRIAFANPLLEGIDKLLFIKRDAMPDSEGQGGHMCDQYFGHNSTNGGSTRDRYGLFVLDRPFSANPVARDLLEESIVQSGRLKDKKLVGGGYLSPDVSFDGRQILFAYSEGSLEKWKIDSSFHIFKVNRDGTGLVQLTDGTANDFDPCFLPNGRIAFISERRGGYGRCHGRPVPSYTLHSMRDDGSDIVRLSPHETNEWQPSVSGNGMIVYTRWDYVDRGFNQAHHPWITYPDGTDPRAIHGNTRKTPGSAPFLEAYVRSIPGSPLYIATAAAHHGEFRGSIILIDPRAEDDDALAPVKRVTPDQLFPEAETRYHKRGAYATAWPLSEDYYLCVYDHDANGSFGAFDPRKTNYGIYLLDKFGNKDLIYRDELVSCLDPMPLAARPSPLVIPHKTLLGRPLLPGAEKPEAMPAEKLPETAAVGLVNVYDSLHPFPEGEKVTHLRIYQLLPKFTFPADSPRIGAGSQKGAKQVLGTVPVEQDGSAYFEMPAGIPVLFHALGADGSAIQGMRSATYVAPGERLVCSGCHEKRTGTPFVQPRIPMAFERSPSKIEPAPEGSLPFSFARLVQPVLDRKCVSCHEKMMKEPAAPKPPPVLSRGDFEKNSNYWFDSFNNLIRYCFFYTDSSFTQPSTIPGKFGARNSELYRMLKKGHHEVKLTPEEWERLIIWMDGNCTFYGHEVDIKAQAEGKVVYPPFQ